MVAPTLGLAAPTAASTTAVSPTLSTAASARRRRDGLYPGPVAPLPGPVRVLPRSGVPSGSSRPTLIRRSSRTTSPRPEQARARRRTGTSTLHASSAVVTAVAAAVATTWGAVAVAARSVAASFVGGGRRRVTSFFGVGGLDRRPTLQPSIPPARAAPAPSRRRAPAGLPA